MTDRDRGSGAHAVRSAVLSARASQGRARQFWQLFNSSRAPMVVVDNDLRYLAANPPGRLLFRLNLAEMTARRIEDFTPPHMLGRLHEAWGQLGEEGIVAGEYDVGFPDGSGLTIVYCALANILPGQHLIVFVPADWTPDDLDLFFSRDRAALPGRLSPREQEVLTLIASGADLAQIAQELTVSVATVRTHARNALRKLGARNRAHAIALAMQHGLIQPGDAPREDPPSAI